MERNHKFTERNNPTYKREPGKKREVRTGKKEPYIVFSFRDFDRNQGQNFKDWEQDKLLLLLINKLHEISQLTKNQAITKGIIKQYTKTDFPPISKFKHPKHIMNDVTWCSIHIQGKECVIGYFEENVFYLVFLDKNHEFWITKKKNT